MADVKPWKPRNPVVAPHKPERMHLDASERQLFDSVAQEHVGIAGTTIDFYSLSVSGSKRDPLYDEAIEHRFKGPFRLRVWVSYPDNSIDASDRGTTGEFSGTVWFPRKELEDNGAPIPSEGDVFRIWNIPYWNDSAVSPPDPEPVAPGRGFYFSITNVDEDGVMFDNPDFVGVSCEYRRRSEFTPERRIGDDL